MRTIKGGGDTQTLLTVKNSEFFALSGGRDAKTSAASPLAQVQALVLTPKETPGGISTTLFLYDSVWRR